MTEAPRWPKTQRAHVGLWVRTLCTLQTKEMRIPAGTVMQIDWTAGSWKFNLLAPACTCCGVSAVIRKVPRSELELIGTEKPEGTP